MNLNDIKTIIGLIMMISAFILFMTKVRTNFSRLEYLYEMIESIKTNVSTNASTIADINLHNSQLQTFQNEYDTTYMWPWFGLVCISYIGGLCIIYL